MHSLLEVCTDRVRERDRASEKERECVHLESISFQLETWKWLDVNMSNLLPKIAIFVSASITIKCVILINETKMKSLQPDNEAAKFARKKEKEQQKKKTFVQQRLQFIKWQELEKKFFFSFHVKWFLTILKQLLERQQQKKKYHRMSD